MKFWPEVILGLVVGIFVGVTYLSVPEYLEMAHEAQVLVQTPPAKTMAMGHPSGIVVVKPLEKQSSESASVQNVATDSSRLQEIVQNRLNGSSDVYGVVIKNLKTGEGYSFNANNKFTTASLYKLWVMGATFEQMKLGKFTSDDVISADAEKINRDFGISDEDAEQTSGGFTYTISQAMNKMVDLSDNYAAMMLIEKNKIVNVNAFVSEYGFTDTNIGDNPMTTPEDVEKFFELLYDGKVVDSESSETMMRVLKAQQLNYLMPKYLPPKTVIAHKTGQYGQFTHDAGIVFSDKGDFIMVLMAQSQDTKSAEERMARLAKEVYDYFNQGGQQLGARG